MKIAVVGAGSWGTAVANLLATNGNEVVMWARNIEVVDSINEKHCNPRYLQNLQLPLSLIATSDIQEAVSDSDAVVMVTPSIAVRETASSISSVISAKTPVAILSKGVEQGTSLLMTEVLAEVLGNVERLAVVSGPNHAEEVSKGIPSGTVVAAYHGETAQFFQNLFTSKTFRVYTSDDVIGVELCAASKNIVAIGAGVSDGLGFGDNTKAMIMTRGLAEISRLVETMGGNPLTCMGLAGMGDLIATCTSRHSRNRLFGEMIARGETMDDFASKTHMVAEGAIACLSVSELAQNKRIDLPLTNAVRGILYEGKDPLDEVPVLMGRTLKNELS